MVGSWGNPAMLGGRYASRLPLQENRGPEAEGGQLGGRCCGGSEALDCVTAASMFTHQEPAMAPCDSQSCQQYMEVT